MLTLFTIRTRIFTGFGIVIAMSLGLAAFGVIQMGNVSSNVRQMDLLAGNVSNVLRASNALEAIRRRETQLRLGMDDTLLAGLQDREREAENDLATAARVTPSAERRRAYNAVRDALATHGRAVDRFIRLLGTEAAVKAGLFSGGDTLTAATTRMLDLATTQRGPDADFAARINAAVLLVRIANWRFLATSDPKGPANFQAKVEGASLALSEFARVASPSLRAPAATVRTALNAYATGFGGFSAAHAASLALYDNTLEPQIEAMQSTLGDAEASLQKAFKTSSDDTNQVVSGTVFLQQVLAAAGLAAGIALALLIGRGIVRPMTGMTRVMTALAAGDTTVDVPSRGNADEIGEMARAVDVFRQQALENTRMSEAATAERAAKDRRQKAMDAHTQDFGASISGVMESLSVSASAMRRSALDVADGARKTRSSTSSTVEGAGISAQALSAVAAAAEEMASSITEISRQVSHVTSSVQTAVARAAETDSKVLSLSEAADRIGDVVRLITDIASRTNLLALNATIEAARAGEAGKGFAVVANEVKALATQTARATDQIANQIVAIRGATGEAVTAVRDVGGAIGQVEMVATAIAAAVEQQAAATREITNSVQNVNDSTAAAAAAMNEVLAIAEATDSTSQSALDVAEEVGRTSETLRREVTDFLTAMSRGDETERRRYERIPAQGMTATLRVEGRAAHDANVQDISRGGAALLTKIAYPVGTEIELGFPGGIAVKGRVARVRNDIIGISLRQDDATLSQIDRVLAQLRERGTRQAA